MVRGAATAVRSGDSTRSPGSDRAIRIPVAEIATATAAARAWPSNRRYRRVAGGCLTKVPDTERVCPHPLGSVEPPPTGAPPGNAWVAVCHPFDEGRRTPAADLVLHGQLFDLAPRPNAAATRGTDPSH